MVFRGLVTACRRATTPTSRSPVFENATMDGVVRNPSAFAITLGSPPSMTATHELVVPKSIPTTLPMTMPFLKRPQATRAAFAARVALRRGCACALDLDLDFPGASLLGLGDVDLQ